MGRIHEGLEYKTFDMPEGITSATVCKKSGKVAVSGLCDCDPRGSMVETEYFITGTAPTEVCDHHVNATVCSSSGLLAGEFCPDETKQTTVYIVGGSSASADGAYLLSEELANSTCTVHTSAAAPPPVGGIITDGDENEDENPKDETPPDDNPDPDNGDDDPDPDDEDDDPKDNEDSPTNE